MQVDPQRVETLKAEIICKKYMAPEKVGSLYLPEQVREDKTGSLWEVVKSNPKADLEMGEKVGVGDIIRVRWGHSTSLGVQDKADERELYLIKAGDVAHRIKNTWDTVHNQQEEK